MKPEPTPATRAPAHLPRAEARRLLDAARAGANVSEAWITRALQATGDLPPDASQAPEVIPFAPVASFLNRCGSRVMRGAGDVVEASS